jgi:uncharacterized protein YcbX
VIVLLIVLFKTAFPNTSAYMILSEGSVDELNSRLEKKVTPVQFRPNLVISGCAPFNEVGNYHIYVQAPFNPNYLVTL